MPKTTNIHATAVAITGRGVVLMGPSGSGKSDLALRLMDRGARLIADDQLLVSVHEGQLFLSPPPAIAGLIEVRGVGILPCAGFAAEESCPAALVVDLSAPPDRLPQPETVEIAGIPLPLVRLHAFHASAPIKVEQALALLASVD